MISSRYRCIPPYLRLTFLIVHSVVKPAIFEDIAQEAINLCRLALVAASENIARTRPPSSVLDGHLFLVRHLLILKEMTNNLDFIPKDAAPKFVGVTGELSSCGFVLN
jgi:hypothetical protein